MFIYFSKVGDIRIHTFPVNVLIEEKPHTFSNMNTLLYFGLITLIEM